MDRIYTSVNFTRSLPLHERLQAFDRQRASEYKKECDNSNRPKRSLLFQNDKLWNERLAALGINQATYDLLTDSPGESLFRDTEALRKVQQFYFGVMEFAEEKESTRWNENELDMFHALSPVRKYLRNELRKALPTTQHFASLFVDFEKLISNLLGQFNAYLKNNVLANALVFELNVAREGGLLIGKNPSERFRYFVQELTSQDEWLKYFFHEYPVLLYELSGRSINWIRNTSNLLTRLNNDIVELNSMFFARHSEARVKEIELFKGDIHRSGNSVCFVHFEDGTKVVYKPRSFQIDVGFYQFIHWLRDKGHPVNLYEPKILEKGEYGWIEFVNQRKCENIDAVKEHFQAIGELLAVFYVLGSKDIIADNIICSGGAPCLVDLECVVGSQLPRIGNGRIVYDQLHEMYFDSVVRTGILPRWTIGETGQAQVVISALTIDGGIERETLEWEYKNTDEMKQVVRNRTTKGKNDHLPKLQDVIIPIDDYTKSLLLGFKNMYDFIFQQREELLAEGGPLTAFEGAESRVLFRDTAAYQLVHRELHHPSNLAATLNYDSTCDNLWTTYDGGIMTAKIVQSECQQLCTGDVPFFISKIGSRDLFDGDEKVIHENYFPRNAVEEIKERVRMMDNYKDFQMAIIEGTLATYFDGAHVHDRPIHNFIRISLDNCNRLNETGTLTEDLIRFASEIGDQLIGVSFQAEDEIGWAANGRYETLGKKGKGGSGFGILNSDLYSGISGFAYFFLYLYKMTGEQRYASTALRVISQTKSEFLERLEKGDYDYSLSPERLKAISSLAFPMSLLHLLDHASVVYDSSLWEDNIVDKIYGWLSCLIGDDTPCDIIYGAAGAIPLLLNIYERTGDTQPLRLAELCGKHIVNNSLNTSVGLGWPDITNFKDQTPLGGFSHGTSGICYSLFRLASVLGNGTFFDIARKGLAYDRSLFNREMCGWPDPKSDNSSDLMAWCHGSGGVGLSRVLISIYEEDAALPRELEIAMDNLIKKGFGGNQCLCHGDLGNLEIVKAINNKLRREEVEGLVYSYLAELVQQKKQSKIFKTGHEGLVIDLLSLFTGLAGIGYALLRFADWDNIPSVLSLEGPLCNLNNLH